MSNKLIMTSLILIFCFSTFSSASSAEDKPAKPRPKITISKETTFITEPLDADGYPDYVAALNQHCSRGVTPENNAAVLFWKAVGPAEIEPERREQYFKMLGMAPLPEKGEYFRSFYHHADLHKKPPVPGKENTEVFSCDPIFEQIDIITQRPWSREEFPIWAEWLKVNERPMVLLTEASKRSRRYDPCFRLKDESFFHIPIIDVFTPLSNYRNVLRAFTARAMLRVHEGKVDQAWEDLLTCHRFARLIGQGPTMVEVLVAITLDDMTQSGDITLIGYAKLPCTRITAMQKEIDSLPPLFNPVEVVGYGERIYTLDTDLLAVRKTPAERNAFYLELEKMTNILGEADPSIKPLLDILGDAELDWDLILRDRNEWFDRLVEAFRKPLRSDRRNAIAFLKEELEPLRKKVADVEPLEKLSVSDLRKLGSERVAQAGTVSLVSAISLYNNALERMSMISTTTKLGFALARYKADHGSYPAKLDDLKPKYLRAVPVDFFNNDSPLNYSRGGEGYLLYSVGLNGVDDGGKGIGEGGNCDDVVVRVPVTKK